jgi:hypothetical protein
LLKNLLDESVVEYTRLFSVHEVTWRVAAVLCGWDVWYRYVKVSVDRPLGLQDVRGSKSFSAIGT